MKPVRRCIAHLALAVALVLAATGGLAPSAAHAATPAAAPAPGKPLGTPVATATGKATPVSSQAPGSAAAAKASPASAGSSAAKALPPGLTVEEVVKRINQANAGLKSWRAHFTQRRNFVHFNSTESRSGTISFRRGNGLRIDVVEPDAETIVVTPKQALQWRPKTRQLHVFNLKGDEGASGVSPLPFSFGATGFEPTKDNDVRLLDTSGGEVALELTARTGETAEGAGSSSSVYVRKVIWIDPQTWLPLKVQLVESTDDVVHFGFTDIELDPALDPQLFVLKAPAGADVVEHTDLPSF